MSELVILVDEADNEIGIMPKLEAHEKGLLHRAVSVFLFNSKGEMLLQKRAGNKYHSGGLWSNTCCSHPRIAESTKTAAMRRLYEEMGIISDLEDRFSFVYKASLDNGLTEYEFDHVFTGICDTTPAPDSNEVSDWKYMDVSSLLADVSTNPQHYTEWFRICIRDKQKQLFDSK